MHDFHFKNPEKQRSKLILHWTHRTNKPMVLFVDLLILLNQTPQKKQTNKKNKQQNKSKQQTKQNYKKKNNFEIGVIWHSTYH